MSLIGNIDFLSVGIAVAAMAVMGFSVLFSNYKSTTNRSFFYFVILGSIWGFFHLMSYRITNNVPLALLFIRIELFLAVWYVFSIFHLFYVFPSEKSVILHWSYKIILIPVTTIVSLLTLTPFVFSGVDSLTINGAINTPKIGQLFLVFLLTVIGILIVSFLLFFIKTIKVPKKERNKFYLLLVGSVITFSLIIYFIPIQIRFNNNSNFNPFGAVFLLPFVIFASYAIIHHKLFNIRVVGAALLVFTLSIVSFFEVVLSSSFTLIIYRSVVLVLVLIFGILLIRGVLREVKQREQIESMAKELERAYAVEKRANEELKNLDKTKNQFLLTIQHHLRTPLTSMMGYSDLLLKGAFGKQNKKTTEVIQRFQTSTQGLIKMVNDFLDITQFQLGKSVVSLRPGVELLPMIDEIISDLKFKAESKGISLRFYKPAENFNITADREKLKAALNNVFDNAVKYTKEGGVTVEIIKNNTNLKIIVSDTGMGVPKENLANLFGKIFERGEQAQASTTGSGIGLYLTGQIIKSHNGKIWAESQGQGKGTTFYIELPISQGQARTQVEAPKVVTSNVPPESKAAATVPIKNL